MSHHPYLFSYIYFYCTLNFDFRCINVNDKPIFSISPIHQYRNYNFLLLLCEQRNDSESKSLMIKSSFKKRRGMRFPTILRKFIYLMKINLHLNCCYFNGWVWQKNYMSLFTQDIRFIITIV